MEIQSMATRPKLRTDVEIQQLDEHETLVYDPQSDNVHVLNSTAALIANLCDGHHTLEEIAAELQKQFTVGDETDVLADVEETLDSLQIQGLLQL
jgi:PqqD family protein of HPr-rel-A system